MKKFMKEFKAFISRGNVMDMAVGIIIGGAFTAIVNSLVNDIINPLLGLFGGMNLDRLSIPIKDEVTLNYGSFIANVLNFLLMALVVFLIVKAVNAAVRKFEKKEEKVSDTKECPYCMSKIAIKATRCPNCTSVLESMPEEK